MPTGKSAVPWWLLLVAVLALALFVHPIAAVAVLALVIIQRARPLDFLTSYMMVVVVGSFINYGGGFGSGALTSQLSVLTVFLVFMLYCYVLSRRWDSLILPQTPATLPLLLFFGLTLVNFVRGIAIGNSLHYGGLELLACLALVSCLLVSSRKFSEREYQVALLWLCVMGTCHFFLGAYVLSLFHRRLIGLYFSPVPGVVAMLVFNFALRARTRAKAVLWLLVMVPLLAHQFLSFTRGFWMAIIAGILFSLIVYIGRSEGARDRARSAGFSLAFLGVVAAVSIGVIAVGLGIGHVFELAGNRFASSAGTKYSWESSSNVVRLVEYFHVLDLITENPIFGHGLGYFFVVREPVYFSLIEQWFVHENYLLVTLKQGLIGLGLWVWLLVAFVRVGVNGRRLPNLDEQAWCTGAGAVVIYIMVYSLVHFPLAETNTTFTFAMILGAAMRMTSRGSTALRWKGRRSLPEQA